MCSYAEQLCYFILVYAQLRQQSLTDCRILWLCMGSRLSNDSKLQENTISSCQARDQLFLNLLACLNPLSQAYNRLLILNVSPPSCQNVAATILVFGSDSLHQITQLKILEISHAILISLIELLFKSYLILSFF